MAMVNLASACQPWGTGPEVTEVDQSGPVSSLIAPSLSRKGGWVILKERNTIQIQNTLADPGTNTFYLLFSGRNPLLPNYLKGIVDKLKTKQTA